MPPMQCRLKDGGSYLNIKERNTAKSQFPQIIINSRCSSGQRGKRREQNKIWICPRVKLSLCILIPMLIQTHKNEPLKLILMGRGAVLEDRLSTEMGADSQCVIFPASLCPELFSRDFKVF